MTPFRLHRMTIMLLILLPLLQALLLIPQLQH